MRRPLLTVVLALGLAACPPRADSPPPDAGEPGSRSTEPDAGTLPDAGMVEGRLSRPPGLTIHALASSGGKLVAAGREGLFALHESGARWVRLGNAPPTPDSQLLVRGSELWSHLYPSMLTWRSVDQGRTWDLVPGDAECLALDGTRLFAIDNDQGGSLALLEWDEGPAAWRNVEVVPYMSPSWRPCHEADGASMERTSAGLARTRPLEAVVVSAIDSWNWFFPADLQPRAGTLGPFRRAGVDSLWLDESNGRELLRSRNGGLNWEVAPNAGLTTMFRHIVESAGDTWLLQYDGEVFRLGGATWEPVETEPRFSGFTERSLAGHRGQIFLAGETGVARWNGGGWTSVFEGLEEPEPSAGGHSAWVLRGSRLFHRAPEAAGWSSSLLPSLAKWHLDGRPPSLLAEGSRVAVLRNFNVIISEDDGATMREVSTPGTTLARLLEWTDEGLLALGQSDTNQFGQQQLQRLAPGASTWDPVGVPAFGVIEAAVADGAVVAAVVDRRLQVASTLGESWRTTALEFPLTSALPVRLKVAGDRLFMATRWLKEPGPLWESSDRGASWTQSSFGPALELLRWQGAAHAVALRQDQTVLARWTGSTWDEVAAVPGRAVSAFTTERHLVLVLESGAWRAFEP